VAVGAPPGGRRTSTTPPPGPGTYGFWVALDHFAPGVMQDFTAEDVVLFAPAEASWAVVRTDPASGTTVVDHGGTRDIWAQAEDVHARWVRAGRPQRYRIEVAAGGTQHVTSGTGAQRLEWQLPTPPSGRPSVGTS